MKKKICRISLILFGVLTSAHSYSSPGPCFGQGKEIGHRSEVTHCLCGIDKLIYSFNNPSNPCYRKFLETSNRFTYSNISEIKLRPKLLLSTEKKFEVPPVISCEINSDQPQLLVKNLEPIVAEVKKSLPIRPKKIVTTLNSKLNPYKVLGVRINDEMKKNPKIDCPTATEAQTELKRLCETALQDKSYRNLDTSKFRKEGRSCGYNTSYKEYYTTSVFFPSENQQLGQGHRFNSNDCHKHLKSNSGKDAGVFILQGKQCQGRVSYRQGGLMADMIYVNLSPTVLLECAVMNRKIVIYSGLIVK
jgi:hypothetical protein